MGQAGTGTKKSSTAKRSGGKQESGTAANAAANGKAGKAATEAADGASGSARHGAAPLLLVGHRGAMGVEPENTVRSFRRALADGVDAVELDVRRTSDGVLVICHDSQTSRTTNGEGEIHDLTLAELRAFDAGQGERIPTFDEVLDAVDGVPIQVELKAVDALPLVVETVRRRELGERVILTSFHPEMLRVMRYLLPDVPRGLIFSGAPDDAVEQAAEVEAELVAPRISHLSRRFVQRAHEAGLEVCAWPVNDEDELRLALLFGVDQVTTDYPELRRILGAGTG